VVETNREILCEAKAYGSASLSLTDFAQSREPWTIFLYVVQYFVMSAYWVVPVHSPQSLSKIYHSYLLLIMKTKFSFLDMQTTSSSKMKGDEAIVCLFLLRIFVWKASIK